MSFTDLELHEGRRLVAAARDARLELGDLFGRLEGELATGTLAERLGISARTAQAYRHTARMCTPPVRELIAGSDVLVCYTVLREGAHLGPSGVPRDESYRELRDMMEQTHATGGDHISIRVYQRKLGVGPELGEMLKANGGQGGLGHYLSQLRKGPERDQLIGMLIAEAKDNAEVRQAVREAMAEQRAAAREHRRENGLLEGPDPRNATELAFSREVLRVADQAERVMDRFLELDPTDLLDEMHSAAVTKALATLEVIAAWLRGEGPAGPDKAVPKPRTRPRVPVTA